MFWCGYNDLYRNKKKLEAARDQLLKIASNNQKIISQVADVSKEEDVELVASNSIDQLGGCHILVNNAGSMVKNTRDNRLKEWIKTIEINLYGSILVCRSVIKHFKQQKYGKIIQLSGGGATNPLQI